MQPDLRELAGRLERRFELPVGAGDSLACLVRALGAESHPPTAVRDPLRALDLHVADSLAGLACEELRHARRIADIGSGAGFPGLPLAIALPDARVDLIESTGRKRQVIERLIAGVGMGNARSIPMRAEELAAAGSAGYAAVTARAVGSLPVLVEYAAPLLSMHGALVAWKGARADVEEREGARAGARVGLDPDRVIRVEPFEGARQRHLHVYRKVALTPEGFPRRPGIAAKRPLGGGG